MKRIKKDNILSKNKNIIITICVFIVIIIACFVVDYFNVPSKTGANLNFINFDFWDILVSNGIVITLFLITFFLFDKRQLEKEKLADYAGAIVLLDTYKKCESFLTILNAFINTDDLEERHMLERQIDFINNEPFKNNDTIFECLKSGHILREHYDGYSKIKRDYEALVVLLFRVKNLQSLEKSFFDTIVENVGTEREKLEKYCESLKL